MGTKKTFPFQGPVLLVGEGGRRPDGLENEFKKKGTHKGYPYKNETKNSSLFKGLYSLWVKVVEDRMG
jgi:hypothetical protein